MVVAPEAKAYSMCGFTLVTGGGAPARWEIDREWVDPHLAITRVLGDVALGDPLPCVGGPGPEVRVGTLKRAHRRDLAVLPIGEWIDLGGGVWCSHNGTTLSISAAPVPFTWGGRHQTS